MRCWVLTNLCFILNFKLIYLVWCNALLLTGWLEIHVQNHELYGVTDPSGNLSKFIWWIFSMNAATGRYKISKCPLLSIAANVSIYFCNSCQKGSDAGFCEWPLGFWKFHNKPVLFDSRIRLTRHLSTTDSFWLEPTLSSSIVKRQMSIRMTGSVQSSAY